MTSDTGPGDDAASTPLDVANEEAPPRVTWTAADIFCHGRCLTGADIGMWGNGIAVADPWCEAHGSDEAIGKSLLKDVDSIRKCPARDPDGSKLAAAEHELTEWLNEHTMTSNDTTPTVTADERTLVEALEIVTRWKGDTPASVAYYEDGSLGVENPDDDDYYGIGTLNPQWASMFAALVNTGALTRLLATLENAVAIVKAGPVSEFGNKAIDVAEAFNMANCILYPPVMRDQTKTPEYQAWLARAHAAAASVRKASV